MASRESGGKLARPACVSTSWCIFDKEKILIRNAVLSAMADCVAVMEYAREWAIDHPEITKLVLFSCQLTAEGADVVRRVLIPALASITVFNISSNPDVGDDGVCGVAGALGEHCPRLETAYFASVGMGDAGLRAVCRHLPTTLTNLSVSSNRITSIPAELRRLHNLTTVYCTANPWSDEWAPTGDGSDAASALAHARGLADEDEADIMVKPAVD